MPNDDFQQFMALLSKVLGPSGPDPHHHKCPSCSFIWGHDKADIEAAPDPHSANEAAHTCPSCGCAEDGCWSRWHGELPGNPAHT